MALPAPPNRPGALPPISEREFLAQVIEYARLRGWRTAHFRPARTGLAGDRWRTAVQGDGAGFCDLVLCRGPVLLVVELKTDRGQLTAAQREWVETLRLAGVRVRVWRPRDFDLIRRELE